MLPIVHYDYYSDYVAARARRHHQQHSLPFMSNTGTKHLVQITTNLLSNLYFDHTSVYTPLDNTTAFITALG